MYTIIIQRQFITYNCKLIKKYYQFHFNQFNICLYYAIEKWIIIWLWNKNVYFLIILKLINCYFLIYYNSNILLDILIMND